MNVFNPIILLLSLVAGVFWMRAIAKQPVTDSFLNYVAQPYKNWRSAPLGLTLIILPILGQWNGFMTWSTHYRHPISGWMSVQFVVNILIYLGFALLIYRATRSKFWLFVLTIYAISFLIGDFSGMYFGLGTKTNWGMPLSHLDAVYVATGVLTTAGTGNITPMTDAARRLVLVQMLVDFVVIAILLAVIAHAIAASFSDSGPQRKSRSVRPKGM